MPEDTSLEYQSTIRESVRTPVSGLLVLVLLLGGLLACGVTLIVAGQQRQPAVAVVAVVAGVLTLFLLAARQKIVEGAVSMVEMALQQLGDRNIVRMDEDRKAAMVSNLMVVLCSEHNAQPVLNTGAAAAHG